MYGLINLAIKDLITSTFSAGKWEEITQRAGLASPNDFALAMKQYPDELTYKLVTTASEVLDAPVDSLLESFGEFWITSTAEMGYNKIMDMAGTSFEEFLLNLNALHTSVLVAMPEMQPPTFRCFDVQSNSMLFQYFPGKANRHGLSSFIVGLLKGLAKRFSVNVRIEHRTKRQLPDIPYDEFYLEWTDINGAVPVRSSSSEAGDYVYTPPAADFAAAFPFHLAFDRQLNVVQCGTMMRRLALPKFRPPHRLSFVDAGLKVLRPSVPITFQAFAKNCSAPFVLGFVHTKLQFKGQMLPVDAQGVLYYLCSPLVETAEEAGAFGITLKDFAIHDATKDVLFQHQIKKRMLYDVVKLEESSALQDGQRETVAQQTRELLNVITKQNADLEEAKNLALEAAKVKAEFLSNMSHELRTPLNGVLGMTSLLMDSNIPAADKEHITVLRSCGEHLLHVINEILDFSKIEAGRVELETLEFNLMDAVDEAVDLMAFSAEEKGLDLFVTFEPDVPRFVASDQARLKQILINLINNAIKFTEQGEVEVRVSKIADLPGGMTSVNFSVRDTGIGLDPSDLGRLFQAFSQLDGSITRRFGGTGLGLMISKQLAALFGGELSASSDGKGFGSTFFLSVPIRHVPGAPGGDPRVAALANLKLLVVARSVAQAQAIVKLTQCWPSQVMAATLESVPSVVEMGNKARFHFNAVLLDLPLEQAATLCTQLRSQLEPGVVICRTISFSRRSEASEPTTEFDGSISKPIKYAALVDLMSAAAATAHSNGTTTASPPKKRQRQEPSTKPSVGPVPHAADFRILVAEDNSVNQLVARQLLTKLGFARIDMAGNGLEAVGAVKLGFYDIILMDIHMPELDGYEATQRIRSLQIGGRRSAIVAVTAAALPDDRNRALESGCDDVLVKPITVASLRTVLSPFIGQPYALHVTDSPSTEKLPPDPPNSLS